MGDAAQRPWRRRCWRQHVPHGRPTRRDRRAHSPRAGSRQHRRTRPRQPRRLPRAWRRSRRHPRRGRRQRHRLVQIHHRRLLAPRPHQVARSPDAPLFCRSRSPDHPRRFQLADERRDLLRHGSLARRSRPRHRLHAQSHRHRRQGQQRGPSPRRRGRRQAQRRQHLRPPAAALDLRTHRSRRHAALPRFRFNPRSPL